MSKPKYNYAVVRTITSTRYIQAKDKNDLLELYSEGTIDEELSLSKEHEEYTFYKINSNGERVELLEKDIVNLKEKDMDDKIYNFYLNTNEHTYEPILMFKGTLSAFEKVEQLYGELWFNVIDNQLGLLNFDNGYPVDSLTDDPVLLKWEGSDIEAIDIETKKMFWYLGDGILEEASK